MASEIQVSVALRATKGFLELSEQPTALQVDMAANTPGGGVQIIGFASHEALSNVSDIGTAGWAFFRNLDVTNYVELGLDVTGTFVPFCKLLPGEYALVPLSTTAVYAKANTAAVNLRWLILPR